MFVKFNQDWRGYRAHTVRDIGNGEGELLVIRKIASPADGPDKPKAKPKRKRRARQNNTADDTARSPE